jgi:hypothetical protein
VHSLTVLAGYGYGLGAPFGFSLPMASYRGDGALRVVDTFMPQANNYYFAMQHAKELENPDVKAKIAEALLTDGKPRQDEHYYAQASDVPAAA